MPCPLCAAPAHWLLDDRKRSYWQCEKCLMVHVPKRWQLSAEQEKAEYDRHENHPDDPGYRRFLSRLAEPLLQRLPAASSGLDFGCGPGPALAVMLREHGHQVALHDLYYHPNPEALRQQWDFITATEVVEHLAAPREVLEQLWQCLKPGGWLGLMTKRVSNPEAFRTWHYKSDPTHISFFSEQSFRWLATRWQAELEVIGADVVLLRKPMLNAG
ncbi:methyltransferase [Halopseudomonas oceani]|uniref:2-polyprenyl-3-methyl-5-hydroxy-6-metoxy-1, 4-benzoquinol methylase n=2 Tax=Halopseudomonas oceani TaxID=1708783 RepID=A0A2P4EXK8_9GAMM|nr:2-polyprenyl-3-methyl-5-hydroxy-6-metoxy-1,4-benzoquinol methylase [Halopseudomonas oceani]GGE38372.1 methyltransferase [Halopseudomonas oceani]